MYPPERTQKAKQKTLADSRTVANLTPLIFPAAEVVVQHRTHGLGRGRFQPLRPAQTQLCSPVPQPCQGRNTLLQTQTEVSCQAFPQALHIPTFQNPP